jgi:hypothetical protein
MRLTIGMLFNYLKPAAAIASIDYNLNLIPSRLRVVTTALRADRRSVLTLTRRTLLKESVPARKQVLELTLH